MGRASLNLSARIAKNSIYFYEMNSFGIEFALSTNKERDTKSNYRSLQLHPIYNFLIYTCALVIDMCAGPLQWPKIRAGTITSLVVVWWNIAAPSAFIRFCGMQSVFSFPCHSMEEYAAYVVYNTTLNIPYVFQ